jgi:hypothetical protein
VAQAAAVSTSNVTDSPVSGCWPPYGTPSIPAIVGAIVGAAQFESITICAFPMAPDVAPTALTWTVYVPGVDGVNVGDATVVSLNAPPPGGDTDHANA